MPPDRPDAGNVTIHDVAEEAGVSAATVSRFLNGSGKIAEPTAERVRAAVEALRYRPDRTARTLAEPDRRVLAVALPSFITPFHNALLKGIRFELRGFECDLLLRDLGSEDSAGELARFLQHGAVDGLLVVGGLRETARRELRHWRAPAVVIGAAVDGIDSFFWDDAAGGRLAAEHLLAAGHRRIGVIQSARSELAPQEQRMAGYREALEAAGVAYDPALTASGQAQKHAGFSEEAGREAMTRLLDATPPVTAVFALSDVHAMGAWAALRDAGRRVPQDVALVGYDDVKTSQFVGLTSVSQDMHRVGERATACLLDRLRGGPPEEPRSVRIEPALHPRRSSDVSQEAPS
ncbi:MAG: LacI family transcriptional regulator [Bacteroidetes bacterium QS_9_68_14]|nr:MAG: LacI family transcriptional regulator [Bacteroidetes bacterium QS_9_68_14]